VTSSRTLLCLLLVAAAGSAAEARTPSVAPVDCRYARPPIEPDGPARTVFIPDNDVFGPLVADPKEPRLSLGLRHERFDGPPFAPAGTTRTITAGFVTAGGTFGIAGRRREGGCDGFQVGMFGGVFSQFNLVADSRDLINTDFIVGTAFTARRGALSTRVRVYHQSSHFGDEFLVHNPDVVPTEFGLEAIDMLVSLDSHVWRVYGGAGYLSLAFGQPNSALAHAGAELRDRRGDGGFRPLAAADVVSLSARDWGVSANVAGGFEWTSPSAARRFRALVVFGAGYTPFGQSLQQQKLRSMGLEAQFDF